MDYKKNYYQILGVAKTADEAEIKKSFRNLSKTHHPDKGGDTNKFKEINEANSILTDLPKRTLYDSTSIHGKNYKVPNNPNNFYRGYNYEPQQNPYADFDVKDKFKTKFGSDIEDFLRRSGYENVYQKESINESLDIELTINISLEEIYNNKQKDFSYIRDVCCDRCEGSGEVLMNGFVPCHHCSGSGKLSNYNRDTICNNCSGTGKITRRVCDSCNGAKIRTKKETLPLVSLFVISDTQRTITHEGFGNYSRIYKNKVGKLILNLNPVTDNKYKKVGKDLYYKTKIDIKTAILGGTLNYEHLDGKIYSVKIVEKINNNERFKLKEMGLLITHNGNRGDLYIEVEIFIDYNKLTALDYSLIKQLSI